MAGLTHRKLHGKKLIIPQLHDTLLDIIHAFAKFTAAPARENKRSERRQDMKNGCKDSRAKINLRNHVVPEILDRKRKRFLVDDKHSVVCRAHEGETSVVVTIDCLHNLFIVHDDSSKLIYLAAAPYRIVTAYLA